MIKKLLIVFFLFFTTNIVNACVCNPPNIFLEYGVSKYVFFGEIISKNYPKDSLTYTFTFNISRHFKDGENPKTLTFTWPSEARYRNEGVTSCDYDVNVGNKLLVFAKEINGKLSFGLNCSNSSMGLSQNVLNSLLNASRFNILNYHINFDYSLFNDAKPVTKIDSLVTSYKTKTYDSVKEGVIIMFDVDTSGNVTKSNIWDTSDKQVINKVDSAIHIYDIINKEYRKAENEFEIDALEIAKKIQKWEVMRFKNGNIPVNSRQYISFSLNKNHNIIWKQFYFMIN